MEKLIKQKFDSYPKDIKVPLKLIRQIILDVAEEDNIHDLQETLKWGEPSYVCKSGSTVRYDWKTKQPGQYCLYFNCKTSLVDTFREIYGEFFNFENNRAIVFQKDQPIPIAELKHCISLSLRYHQLKNLPLLGA